MIELNGITRSSWSGGTSKSLYDLLLCSSVDICCRKVFSKRPKLTGPIDASRALLEAQYAEAGDDSDSDEEI